ncbi:MAG: hypothetical protein ACJAYF_003217 [Arenicella sp.]|jgi:hypothetical protein
MKKVILNLFLLLTLVLSDYSNATEQIREKIYIGDNVFFFDGYPLEQVFPKKEFHEKYAVDDLCSGAWRGYQGIWSISKGEFFLSTLIKNPCKFEPARDEHFDLKVLFPDYGRPYSHNKAIWFSGEIIIPIGEVRAITGKKTDFGYQAYERQVIVYLIEKGNVMNRKIEYRDT